MKIYHNPKCSKSREALNLIKKNTSKFEIVEYLKVPLIFDEIKLIMDKINLKPIEIIRKNENDWKEDYANREMNENDIINAIVKNPKLLKRPIIISNKGAVIGRPPKNVLTLFN